MNLTCSILEDKDFSNSTIFVSTKSGECHLKNNNFIITKKKKKKLLGYYTGIKDNYFLFYEYIM